MKQTRQASADDRPRCPDIPWGWWGVGTLSDIQGRSSLQADIAGFLLRLDKAGSAGMVEVESYRLGGGRQEFGQRESLCQGTST